jgi:transposase-like protein
LFHKLPQSEQITFISTILADRKPAFVPEINRVESADKVRFKDKIYCPHCGDTHVVKRGFTNAGKQRYLCKTCNHSFIATTNTTLEYTKKELSVWMQYLECLSNQFSIRKSAKICRISIPTAFVWRHKILDVLNRNLSLDKTKLSGIVEADETYFHLSFKGCRKLSQYTDRKPHKRGNSISKRGLSYEQVCVPCAVSTKGKGLSAVGKLGSGNLSVLSILFGNKIEAGTVLCSDKLSAYVQFCKRFHLVHNNSGLKHIEKLLSVHIPHIQHINAYHSTMKRFMRPFNGVSTKYLNNYLTWFNDNRIAGYHFKNFIVDIIFSMEHRENRDDMSFRNPVPVVA